VAQDGLICAFLRHAMKSLPDLFMFISNSCLLRLSLLSSVPPFSLLLYSTFPSFLLPLPAPVDLPHPWVEDAKVGGPQGPAAGLHWDTPSPVSACESGLSSALVSPRSDVPHRIQ